MNYEGFLSDVFFLFFKNKHIGKNLFDNQIENISVGIWQYKLFEVYLFTFYLVPFKREETFFMNYEGFLSDFFLPFFQELNKVVQVENISGETYVRTGCNLFGK